MAPGLEYLPCCSLTCFACRKSGSCCQLCSSSSLIHRVLLIWETFVTLSVWCYPELVFNLFSSRSYGMWSKSTHISRNMEGQKTDGAMGQQEMILPCTTILYVMPATDSSVCQGLFSWIAPLILQRYLEIPKYWIGINTPVLKWRVLFTVLFLS